MHLPKRAFACEQVSWCNIEKTTSGIVTYSLRANYHHVIRKELSNTQWDHVHTEDTLALQHKWSSIKYWARSHTCWGHINTATLVEFIQILNDITYFLRAHWCHNISGLHSNTQQDHILPEGTIDAATLAEFIEIHEITYCLRAHQCRDISRVYSNARQDHVLPEGTSSQY